MKIRLVSILTVAMATALLPSASFAQTITPPQPAEQTSCGTPLPVLTGDEIRLPQPADPADQGTTVAAPIYSAVRGAIVHMEGPLVLLQLDGAGVGNATSNHDLAGQGMAVVHLPTECNLSDFHMGTPILAIGTPTEGGILDAVEITPTA